MTNHPVKVARTTFTPSTSNLPNQPTSFTPGPLSNPFQRDPDPEAIIQPAEDFTISINTISGNLYSRYKDDYLAGKYDNDYFILLSRIGIGDQSQPTTKLNFLEHINEMTRDDQPRDFTDIWAENVAIVEDYRKDGGAQRVYISFHAFCQNLGKDTKLDDMKTAGNRILDITGAIFPTLMPFTAVGKAVVTGVKNIFGKMAENAGECKKVEFNLYPVIDTDEHIPGEAPLQEGSYIIFFEDTSIDDLYLDMSGVVRSNTNTDIPPYIVVNIKKGKRLAAGKLDVAAASEILSHHQKNYSFLLPGSGSESADSSEGFLGALEEFGHSHRIVQSIQRYYQLKDKEARTAPEEAKLQELTGLIQDHFNDPNWA